MEMSEAELVEQERRATMAAAGVDVGKIDGAALCAEVRRLREENEKLGRFMEIFQHEHDVALRQVRDENLALARQLAEAKADPR